MRAEIHDDGEPSLTCHRYPATVFVIDGEPVRAWPDTSTDDWCGEYQLAEDWGICDICHRSYEADGICYGEYHDVAPQQLGESESP